MTKGIYNISVEIDFKFCYHFSFFLQMWEYVPSHLDSSVQSEVGKIFKTESFWNSDMQSGIQFTTILIHFVINALHYSCFSKEMYWNYRILNKWLCIRISKSLNFNDIFFKLLAVLMSPDRTKHMLTVVKIKKNYIITWNLSQQ